MHFNSKPKEPSSFKSKLLVGMFEEPLANSSKPINNSQPVNSRQRSQITLNDPTTSPFASIQKIKNLDFGTGNKNFEIGDSELRY